MRAALVIAFAGCYSPSLIDGQMCSETAHCPEGMSCDPNTNTCVRHFVHCTQWSDFGAPTKLVNLSMPGHNLYNPWLSPDNLELWYVDDNTSPHLQRSRRGPGEDFPTGVPVDQPDDINATNGQPFLSDDLLTLYYNDPNVHVTQRTRSMVTDDFSLTGKRVFPTTPGSDIALTADGLEMVVAVDVGGTADLELSIRASTDDAWPLPIPDAFANANTSDDDCCATISGDGTEVIFESIRGSGQRLYRATRATRDDAFGASELLVGQPVDGANASPTLSRDGTTLVFSHQPGGGPTYDILLAERTCLQSD